MAGTPLSPDHRRCGVLGRPIGHSLSPVLHRAAYAALGLDWRYDAYEVDEDALPPFLESLGPEWRGLSLTMPLKQAALRACHEVSETAVTVGAVNTIVVEPGGLLRGSNTDVPGMVEALRERGITGLGAALVLGAGATACSTVASLAELGARRVTALARDPSRADPLRAVAARLGVELEVLPLSSLAEPAGAGGPTVELAVSTLPAGAADPVAAALAGRAEAVFDVAYDPWPTGLAAAATAAGRTVIAGLDLLVHQAVLQVQRMTGTTAEPVAAMRAAGERALARQEPDVRDVRQEPQDPEGYR